MFATYLLTLSATILVELGVVWLLAPLALRRTCVATALFANLLTHPLATHAVILGGAGFWEVELGVIVVEYLAFRLVARQPARTSVRLAVLANGLTIALTLAFRL